LLKCLLFILSFPLICFGIVPPLTQLNFKENLGQVGDQYNKPRPDVLFSGSDGNMNFHLKNSGISYQLYKIEKQEMEPNKFFNNHFKNLPPSDKVSIYRIDINWLNSNTNPNIEKGEMLSDYNNYYSEVCPNGVTNVRSYKELFYKNIYSGIDLHYYSKDDRLKYDYIVAPHSDHKQIQLEINGAENIYVNAKGELVIATPFGDITEQAPLVLQNGKQLPSKWMVSNNIISFEIKNIDPSYQFIIDPITRVWGTYYGGVGRMYTVSVVVDASGNTCLSGDADSNSGTAVATVGSFQTTFAGGAWDGFIVKFNSNGVRQWGTYYGDAGDEYVGFAAFDASGNVYIPGIAQGSTSLSTAGSHQPGYGGGLSDAFVVKFSSNGSRLWASYYGGNGEEAALACTTDNSGNIYFVGNTTTNSGNIIATPSSFQTTMVGGAGFMAKFNSSGVRQWGTYFGDGINAVATDQSGNLFITGISGSNTNIATPGAFQTSPGQIFLNKFTNTGSRLWGTYYGGNNSTIDNSYYCCTDSIGNAYMCGITNSTVTGLISTPGCHQSNYAGAVTSGLGDGFLVKFSPSGVRRWGTYYGGTQDDYSNQCAVDRKGNVYLTGTTTSSVIGEIASPGAYQTVYNGSEDVYLAKFDSLGVRKWGTYYGGTGTEQDAYCAIDMNDAIYLASFSGSTGTVIATPGSHQSTFSGIIDAFLVKFFDCNSGNGPACVGIEELQSNNTLNLNVYPNPNNGDFTIESEIEMNLNIVNELGQQVQQLKLNSQNNYKTHLDNLNAGVYFLSYNDGRSNTKIVVIK
jgi:hypothetical protein